MAYEGRRKAIRGYLRNKSALKEIAEREGIPPSGLDIILYLGSQACTSELDSGYTRQKAEGKGLEGIPNGELVSSPDIGILISAPSSLSQLLTRLLKTGHVVELNFKNCKRLDGDRRVREVLLSKKGTAIYVEASDRLLGEI